MARAGLLQCCASKGQLLTLHAAANTAGAGADGWGFEALEGLASAVLVSEPSGTQCHAMAIVAAVPRLALLELVLLQGLIAFKCPGGL